MKKLKYTLLFLLISVVVIGATKTIRDYDATTSLTKDDLFITTVDSSDTWVTNKITHKTLYNLHKDSIEINGLDSLNTVGTLSAGGNTDITGTLVVSDSITSVGLGTSGDIQLSGSNQLYGSKERFIAVIYVMLPDTLPSDTAWVIDNFFGATITIDSLRIEHNGDTARVKIFRNLKGETSRGSWGMRADVADTMLCSDSTATAIIMTLAHGGSLGIGEVTGGDTTPTWIKITFIGQYIKAKLNDTGRVCVTPV